MRNKIQSGFFLGLIALVVCATVLPAATPPPGTKERFVKWSARMKNDLRTKVFPYWYDQTVDWENGGYLLDATLTGHGEARDKMIVSQARMVWGFSHAHIKGLLDPQRDYLKAAQQGYEFIRNHFYDTEHGGYFTAVGIEGDPIDRSKTLYGQSFVIYALLEYHRASADVRARNDAIELFKLTQKKAHDSRNNGWFEHFEEDWTVITESTGGAYVIEVPGYKSANAHLHWMEALTALYKENPDKKVKQALAECIEVNQKYFYPKNPSKSAFHRHFDWRHVSAASSMGLSYGHNVEFAWLMVDAQRAIGRDPSWDHFYSIIDHALKNGYDHQRGGVYDRGYVDRPASRTDKVWWVQSEMMAALTEGLRNHVRPDYGVALEKLNHFVWAYMVFPENRIWVNTVSAEGAVTSPVLASNWKAAYHDVRAMVKFYETFEYGNKLRFSWPASTRPTEKQ
jgi:mannobiose 2-epimerase